MLDAGYIHYRNELMGKSRGASEQTKIVWPTFAQNYGVCLTFSA